MFTQIPDLSFEVDDSGDLITLEQGSIEPVTIVIHRIHLEHLAKQLNIGGSNRKSAPSELIDVVADLRSLSEELMFTLEAIPHFPLQDEPSDEVKMANHLVKVADRACAILGIETGSVPLLVDKELAEVLDHKPKKHKSGELFSA